jgi:hypothetical protein
MHPALVFHPRPRHRRHRCLLHPIRVPRFPSGRPIAQTGGYDHYYGGSYSTYRPPTVVNHYYGSGCYDCGGCNSAGAAAVGLAASTAIGTAASANAYAAGVAAGGGYAMGAIYPSLPAGCIYRPMLGAYGCGGTFFRGCLRGERRLLPGGPRSMTWSGSMAPVLAFSAMHSHRSRRCSMNDEP